MALNYHELTMKEPRDSPARRKQFLVICTLGVGVLLNTVINSGGFHPVTIEEGVVPGGAFAYRMHTQDVAAAMSKVRCALDDVKAADADEQADTLYSLYADESSRVPSGETRFFVGGLGNEIATALSGIASVDSKDRKLSEFCDGRAYETTKLPTDVKAGVAQFPFTNGFVSALLLTYKIVPTMSKYARDHGVENPVLFSTCSPSQYMCTHYVPLAKGDKYFLGQPNTAEYAKQLADEAAAAKGKAAVDYEAVWRGIKKMSPL